MQFYEKNLQALMDEDPTLAAKLFAIEENTTYEVFMDPNDDININIYDTKKEVIFYQNRPIDDVTKQYEELMQKYARYPFLFLYGFANGLLVKMFLNLDKYLVVIEPNIELIYIAFNLYDFSKEIKEKKLKIFLQEDLNTATLRPFLTNPDLKVFLKTYDLIINTSYYEHFFADEILKTNRLVIDTISHIITSEGNDVKDSLIGLDHHLQNIPNMLDSYRLKDVAKAKNSDTAVIVSTGPSLAKQLPLLKEYAPYITILCVDASLPILQKEGIAPDFVLSLERVEATAKFYEELDKDLLKDTIFMPTSIVHPKLLENIQGMQQAISMRPFNYTRMFKMHKWGYIGRGMSAANMALDFAYMSKFKNIVFIGQDLAFGEDGTTHSKGAVYGEVEEQYTKHESIKIPGYYGNEVQTSKTWKLFLDFFKVDIPEVVKDGICVYNCTEGGAYIDGAEHIPFREFLQKIEKRQKSKISLSAISKQKQDHYLKRAKKIICIYKEYLKSFKEKVEATFLEIMENIEYLEKLNRDEDLEKIDFDKLAEVISKIDEVKDLLEAKRSRIFGNITDPLIVNAELELATIMVRNSETEIEKKVKMIDWIYAHKSWLFFLAGALENIIFIFEKHYDTTYKDIEVE